MGLAVPRKPSFPQGVPAGEWGRVGAEPVFCRAGRAAATGCDGGAPGLAFALPPLPHDSSQLLQVGAASVNDAVANAGTMWDAAFALSLSPNLLLPPPTGAGGSLLGGECTACEHAAVAAAPTAARPALAPTALSLAVGVVAPVALGAPAPVGALGSHRYLVPCRLHDAAVAATLRRARAPVSHDAGACPAAGAAH